ncbi:MAG: TIGR00266 family protein [Spirochaetales bacterium]|nr:TIGR00266 family protein [Spirochaetales bacterium]
MKIEILLKPANTAAKIVLGAGETLTAEGGSMIAMSSGMKIETTTYKKGQKSIGKALKRIFAGESFFLNHYTASSDGSEVYLSHTMPGDMEVIELNNEKIIVQAGSYVASESGVEINTSWQGFKNVISKESLFWIELSGSGKVVLSSYGAIYVKDVSTDYIVDTGHIVAFEEGLNFSLSKAGQSWVSSFLGGEGLVCKFVGSGRVWCQSHNPSSLGKALSSHLRPTSSGGTGKGIVGNIIKNVTN